MKFGPAIRPTAPMNSTRPVVSMTFNVFREMSTFSPATVWVMFCPISVLYITPNSNATMKTPAAPRLTPLMRMRPSRYPRKMTSKLMRTRNVIPVTEIAPPSRSILPLAFPYSTVGHGARRAIPQGASGTTDNYFNLLAVPSTPFRRCGAIRRGTAESCKAPHSRPFAPSLSRKRDGIVGIYGPSGSSGLPCRWRVSQRPGHRHSQSTRTGSA